MTFGIGTHDFKEIIENDCLFIDKTLFIKELIDDGSKVLLFPRPRRFGKSLNISKCSDRYLSEMNKYPVINLSLKECKTDNYENLFLNLKQLFQVYIKNMNIYLIVL